MIAPRTTGVTWTALLIFSLGTMADEGYIGPADFADYRDALVAPPGDDVASVSFRELWTEPDTFRGRFVRVAGRASRRFRQPPRGEFPPLTELWIVDDEGNPFCLLYPSIEDRDALAGDVDFRGTFLRLIRYRGADAERLAPLIVGPGRPQPRARPGKGEGTALPDLSSLDGWIAGFLAVAVIAILGLQHLRRRPAYRTDLPVPAPSSGTLRTMERAPRTAGRRADQSRECGAPAHARLHVSWECGPSRCTELADMWEPCTHEKALVQWIARVAVDEVCPQALKTMPTPNPLPDTPLTNPGSLGSTLAFHGVLVLMASLVAVAVLDPDDVRRRNVLHAELGPIDNRAPAEAGGGAPGEPGGVGSRIEPVPDVPSGELDSAPTVPSPTAETQGADPGTVRQGVGVAPGSGRGGGGGSGGGSGGGLGKGVGPSTEFFGVRETAASFAYVVDRSGSMSQHGALDLAKAELVASLSQLPSEARVALLFYNNEVVPIVIDDKRSVLAPATAANKERIAARLGSIRATGFTDHIAALQAAFATGAEVVFFLTDARELTPEGAATLRAEAGTSRVRAIVFGVGPEPRTVDPLENLAISTGGSYRYVDVLSRRTEGR